MKKKLLSVGLACLCAVSMAVQVFAISQTVDYKGSAVYWEHGQVWDYSYSKVMSSSYEHCATANSVSSDWIEPCKLAEASCIINPWTTKARAYWACRG